MTAVLPAGLKALAAGRTRAITTVIAIPQGVAGHWCAPTTLEA